MAAGKLQLEIVTPTRLFFSGEVDEVTVPGRTGYLGILPGHAPLLSELKTGVTSYKVDGRQTQLFSGNGFLEVLPDRVSVLVREAARPDEIDLEQARSDQRRAEELLHSQDPEADWRQAVALLEESRARLETAASGS